MKRLAFALALALPMACTKPVSTLVPNAPRPTDDQVVLYVRCVANSHPWHHTTRNIHLVGCDEKGWRIDYEQSLLISSLKSSPFQRKSIWLRHDGRLEQ